jgi:hypothetical protein
MLRGRFILAAALALVGTGALADTPPIVSTDFTLADANRLPTKWAMNGTAGLELNPLSQTPLVDMKITNNLTGQGGVAWTTDTFTVPSFTMWADVNIDFHPQGPGVDATCPADGFALAFANTTSPYVLGGTGGSMGLYGNDTDIPQLISAEVNTWYGNDIDDTATCTTGKNVTFEFTDLDPNTTTGRNMGGDVNSGGAYVGQVTAPDAFQKGLINGGWYRYQWDVDSTTGHMDLYISGLDDSNKSIQNMKVNEVTFAKSAPTLTFAGRFGIAAGTGGGTEGVHVRQVIAVSPAVAGGTAPPAPAAPTAGP